MVANPKPQIFTADEFEQFVTLPENRDRHFELIEGEIVEKGLGTEEHGLIVGNIVFALKTYVNATKQGRVVIEVSAKDPNDKQNVRQPDVSYYADASRPITRKGATPQMPDLAIEIQSPDDTIKSLRDKAAYYLSKNVSMVWLIFPSKRLLEIYTPDEQEVLTVTDTLTDLSLLPSFALNVSDVFAGLE
jgi:Uma2 family endonuclease